MTRKKNAQREDSQARYDAAKAIRQLDADIRAARIYGRVLFSIAERSPVGTGLQTSPQTAADQLVSSVRGTGLGDRWLAISERAARVIAQRILIKDLAYRADIMPPDRAQALVDRFFAQFRDDNWCGTNGTPSGKSATMPLTLESFDSDWGWESVMDATFDSRQVGILWVADED